MFGFEAARFNAFCLLLLESAHQKSGSDKQDAEPVTMETESGNHCKAKQASSREVQADVRGEEASREDREGFSDSDSDDEDISAGVRRAVELALDHSPDESQASKEDTQEATMEEAEESNDGIVGESRKDTAGTEFREEEEDAGDEETISLSGSENDEESEEVGETVKSKLMDRDSPSASEVSTKDAAAGKTKVTDTSQLTAGKPSTEKASESQDVSESTASEEMVKLAAKVAASVSKKRPAEDDGDDGQAARKRRKSGDVSASESGADQEDEMEAAEQESPISISPTEDVTNVEAAGSADSEGPITDETLENYLTSSSKQLSQKSSIIEVDSRDSERPAAEPVEVGMTSESGVTSESAEAEPTETAVEEEPAIAGVSGMSSESYIDSLIFQGGSPRIHFDSGSFDISKYMDKVSIATVSHRQDPKWPESHLCWVQGRRATDSQSHVLYIGTSALMG